MHGNAEALSIDVPLESHILILQKHYETCTYMGGIIKIIEHTHHLHIYLVFT